MARNFSRFELLIFNFLYNDKFVGNAFCPAALWHKKLSRDSIAEYVRQTVLLLKGRHFLRTNLYVQTYCLTALSIIK